ncbi:MAG TPA: carboxypeptidase-like regulatory domain-containing protein, partial [Chitinophagaceae bacterium]|nr:carboxypeptidase-like regulatory domain-containing protein [Chitinophagaceae bacterium]
MCSTKKLQQLCLSLLLTGIFNLSAFAQSSVITGTVTDGLDHTAIAGASVVVKGAAGGSTTNQNGQFQVSASNKAILIISYVGYETREIP